MEAADGIRGGEASGGTWRRRRRARVDTMKLSRTHPPPDTTLEAWQVVVRRQFVRADRSRAEGRPPAPSACRGPFLPWYRVAGSGRSRAGGVA